MRGEADVPAGRDHDVGDDAAFQAAHPVREDLARHPAEGLEALGQHAHRGLGPLVGGEAHEPEPAPRKHRAEHVQPARGTQSITRCSAGDHTCHLPGAWDQGVATT